jgi:hypothetical protein
MNFYSTTANPPKGLKMLTDVAELQQRNAFLEARLAQAEEAERLVADVERVFGCSRKRVVEVARDVMNRANGIAHQTVNLLGRIEELADALKTPPLCFEKLERENELLRGAEQTLLAIEQIIPRNDAHRDYVETIQLFVEELKRRS